MTGDALRRLVERTLRPETTLQPYVPSVFEAAADRPDDTLLEADLESAADGPVGATPSQPDVRAVRAAPPDGGQRSNPAGPLPPPAASPAASSEALPAPESPAVRAPVAEPAPPAPLPRSERVVEQVIERDVATVKTRLIESIGPPAAPRAANSAPGQNGPGQNAPAATAPVLMPALASEPVEQPRPEPVVSITIGRIEVRAMASPSRTPEAPRPRERRVMSLDDYLDRRTRGERE